MAQTHSLDLESASSQYASLAGNAAFLPATYTIEAWIKKESDGALMSIFTKEEAAKGYTFYINATNNLAITHQGVDTLTSSSTIVASNNWVHVAVTWDGTIAKLYINGREDGSSGTLTSVVSTTDTQRIGGRLTTPQDFFDGLIKDVRFFNDVRTQAEIASDAATQTVSNANLIAEWNFNNAATDSSGNGYTLTLNGSPVYSTDIPWEDATQVSGSTYLETSLSGYWTLDETSGTRLDSTANNNDLTDNNTVLYGTGKYSNAADFESTNSEYLSIADASQTGLDMTTDFSLSFWINLESAPGTNGIFTIISKYQEVSTDRNYRFDYSDSGGTKRLLLVVNPSGGAGANVELVKNTTLSTATWYHVVLAYDLSAGTAEYFVNGVSLGTTSGGPTSLANGAAEFCIGRDTTNGSYVDGLIDEVAIYSRQLHYGDVLDLYNGGSGITFTAPAAAAFIPQMIII